MRGQPAIPVFFRSGLRATFFLRTKKEGKDVPGASPPGPPGGLPAFFGGKPAVARLPESTIKKGCGPGAWGWLHFFGPAPTPTPGASGPLVVWTLVQEKTAMPVFLKENRPKARGSGGKAPGVSLHPFSTRRKDVAAHSIPFSVKSRSFCADDPPYPFFLVWPAGHPLSWRQERGKRTVRGLSPLNPRVALSIFSL